MGKKPKTQQVYLATPTPTSAPQQTPQQQQLMSQLQEQLKKMESQYQKQSENLTAQFGANAQTSSSVMTELQQQLLRQKELSQQAADELARARDISTTQTELLRNASAASQAQYADARQQQTDMATSLFGRLQRRQKARQTSY